MFMVFEVTRRRCCVPQQNCLKLECVPSLEDGKALCELKVLVLLPRSLEEQKIYKKLVHEGGLGVAGAICCDVNGRL